MAEHAELVAELASIDKMSTQERLKQARKRRVQQLKKWSQREKEWNSKRKKTEQNMSRKPKNNEYKVHFVPSVTLLEAAARNDIEEVRRLLTLGVSPDSTNEDGLTALHQCCIDDSEDMMKLLLEFGANVNAKDSEQWTPLHAAATCGLIHLVEYLISEGADLLAVNADGNMPYDICDDEATLDFIEVEMAKKGITQDAIDDTRAATEREMLLDLKYISEREADLEFRDHQGATPLHVAAANGYASVVEFLLDHNASTDATDKDLWQPIHAAACWGHPDVIELLVSAGADLGAKTRNGETPFDICEDPELKDRIIQLKCEMETKRASQPHKLRRSQSQNTRSQSVRRTSIREKTQISRREALEEARIRREKRESNKGSEEDEESKLQKDINERENPESREFPTSATTVDERNLYKFESRTSIPTDLTEKLVESNSETSPTMTIITNPLKKNSFDSSKATETKVTRLNNESSTISNNGAYAETSTTTTATASGGLSGESVTVEIKLTFNSSPTFVPNPGTLADLKKQRSDTRNNSIGSNNGDNNNANATDNKLTTGVAANSTRRITATYTYDPPPSPTVNVPKFRSASGEIVGDEETTKRGCCVLM